MRQYSALFRYIALTGIFIMPFIVFLVTPSMFFPFITGKNFAFRVLVEIIFAAWLILAVMDVRYRPQRSTVLWAIIAFVVWVGIANALGMNPHRSFWSNFERMEGYITIIHLLAYGVAAMTIVQAEKLWLRLFQVSVVASIFVSFSGLAQLGEETRIDATLGNSTYLGVYMLFHIFLTLVLLWHQRQSVVLRWVYGLLIVLQGFILFKTGTRGTLLGLVGAFFLTSLLIAFFEKEQKRIRQVAIGVIAVLVLLVGAFFALRDTAVVQNVSLLKRIADISLEDTTTRSRFLLWTDIAWHGIQERPITGWGQENFYIVFSKYYNPRMYDQEQWFDRSHNIIVDWAISAGIPGLLLYIGLYLVLLYVLWFKSPSVSVIERSIITGLLAGYFFHNLFVFDNLISHIFFWTVIAYVHTRSVYTQAGDREETAQPLLPETEFDVPLQKSLIVVIIAVVVGGGIWLNAPGYAAAQELIHGIRSMQQPQGLQASLSIYEEIFAAETFANPEVMLQYYALVSSPAFVNASLSAEERDAIVNQIIAQGEAVLNTRDNRTDVRQLSLHGNFLQRIGFTDEAFTVIEEALSKSPTKQVIIFDFVNNHLVRGDVDGALEQAKRAFELEESFNDARRIYIIVAAQAGEIEIVRTLLAEAPDSFDPSDQGIINALTAAGASDLVEDIIAEAGPTNELLQAQIISAAQAGNQEEARALLANVPEDFVTYSDAMINAFASIPDLETVATLWEERTQAQPTDIQGWASLSATYAELGRIDDAIAVLDQAVKIQPSFAAQADAFIQEIQGGTNE